LGSNVAVNAGASDLVVIDVDVAEHEILSRLEETWTQRTPHGQWHFVYRQPETGPRIRNVKKGVIAPDVETRGEGGYFLVPPSTVTRKDGAIGSYEIHNDIPPQPCPQWIIDIVAAHEEAKRAPSMMIRPSSIMVRGSWGHGRMRAICDRLERTPEGSRNNELISAAGAVGRIVGGGHISFDEGQSALLNVAGQWPNLRKSTGTIKRGLEWGCSHPVYPEENGWGVETMDTSDMDWDAMCGASLSDDEGEIIEVLHPGAVARDDRDQWIWDLASKVRSLGGLCDTWIAWCLRGAVYQQPALAVAGLVALGGTLGSRRWSYRGVTSTSYIVMLAETATGKSRPQECLEESLRVGAPKLLGPGNLVSAKALWRTVQGAANNGHGCAYVLDEYGDQLRAMLTKKSGAGADMHAWLLKLATINARTITWGQSATDGGDIETAIAPGLQILGGTTPGQLHEAIGEGGVVSGFLGRHMWLSSLGKIPTKRRDAHKAGTIPLDVSNAVMAIGKSNDQWLAKPTGSKLDPEIATPVLETPEACAALEAWDDKIEAERLGGGKTRAPAEVLGRALEHAQRVALSLAVLRSGGEAPEVTEAIVRVAVAIVDHSLMTIGRTLAEDVARTEYEKARRDVGKAIAAGATTQRDLARAVRYLSARDLEEQIQRGVAEGRWKYEEGPRKSRVIRLLG